MKTIVSGNILVLENQFTHYIIIEPLTKNACFLINAVQIAKMYIIPFTHCVRCIMFVTVPILSKFSIFDKNMCSI